MANNNTKKTSKKSDEKDFDIEKELQSFVDENIKKSESDEGEEIQDTLYYLEMAQRIKADFDNYKKRNADVSSASYSNGVITAVEKMLPVIDSINLALTKITDSSVVEGVEMIKSQFINSLKNLNITPIKSVGEMFDPNYHNAVLTGSDETKEDQIILEEFQQGFILNDSKVVRYSVVKINKLS